MRKRFAAAALMAAALTMSGTVTAQAELGVQSTATFTKTASWSTGYEARFTIRNTTTTTITSWRVEFDMPSGTSVGTYWDALMTRTGNHYAFTNRDYNGTIAPGASTSFGFVAAGTGDPANCTLNGASCSGGSQPPGAPGVPGNARVTGTTTSSISLAWNTSSGTVTGYRVYEGSSLRATVTGTSTTIGGLGACTSHTYTVAAYNNNGESARSNPASATTQGCSGGGSRAAAPYLYMGWGNPPSPGTVMSATGVRWFTMAFILSGGGCTPAWDSVRPLQGGVDAQAIGQIRAGGGDIVPSIGGWSGNKLGPNCSSAAALAGAYQQVINAYGLRAIDVDIENTDEFESEVVQDRILGALKIIKQNNPNVQTILTFGTGISGPTYWGTRLINRAAALQANVDVFTIMPFNFGGHSNMYNATVSSSEGLKTALRSAFGWDDATAYRHMGISGMNGLSDQQEQTSLQQWTQIKDWARARSLARLAFWSVNRDRPCPGGGVRPDCSGIGGSNWDFTRVTAQF